MAADCPAGDSPVIGVVTAAGMGRRLGMEMPKALVPVNGTPMITLALSVMLDLPGIAGVVVTAPAEALDVFRNAIPDSSVPVSVVTGGASRQESVWYGLRAARTFYPIDQRECVVLVHDAARPFQTFAVFDRVVSAVRAGATSVVPGLPVADTIRCLADGRVGSELAGQVVDREKLRRIQTPQGFAGPDLYRAHATASASGSSETTAASDDAALLEAIGARTLIVAGDELGRKITTAADLLWANLTASQVL